MQATVRQPFQAYMTDIDGMPCYFAGLPGYPRNFSRDTIIAGIIAADHHMLDNQLAMSYLHQGKTYDPITGEEPGKIHHEFPGVMVHGPQMSTYNACDTTALYLTGLEFLKHLNKRESVDFLNNHQKSIEIALQYLVSHVRDDIFWEYPPQNAKHYSLQITYWKDSILPDAHGKEEPSYPVSYALAQFQVARGVLSAANLLHRQDLQQLAEAMFTKGIRKFIRQDAFCIEEDEQGCLEQSSSDEMHALAYIPAKYAALLPLDAIRERAKPLITKAGIACTPKSIGQKLTDTYHGYVVWVFEQALIHYGADKFGLHDIADITTRCAKYIDTGHELLTIGPDIMPRGNSHQLWSVAAKEYFADNHSLRQTNWL
jgi:glycogen debranching enzyme